MASGFIASSGVSDLTAALLAQGASSRGGGVPTALLLWIGVLIVVVVVGGLVLVHVQKRMLRPPSAGPGDAGIMEELRRMRDTGAMTPEEFEATRKAMARKLAPSAGAAKVVRPVRRVGESDLGVGRPDESASRDGETNENPPAN